MQGEFEQLREANLKSEPEEQVAEEAFVVNHDAYSFYREVEQCVTSRVVAASRRCIRTFEIQTSRLKNSVIDAYDQPLCKLATFGDTGHSHCVRSLPMLSLQERRQLENVKAEAFAAIYRESDSKLKEPEPPKYRYFFDNAPDYVDARSCHNTDEARTLPAASFVRPLLALQPTDYHRSLLTQLLKLVANELRMSFNQELLESKRSKEDVIKSVISELKDAFSLSYQIRTLEARPELELVEACDDSDSNASEFLETDEGLKEEADILAEGEMIMPTDEEREAFQSTFPAMEERERTEEATAVKDTEVQTERIFSAEELVALNRLAELSKPTEEEKTLRESNEKALYDMMYGVLQEVDEELAFFDERYFGLKKAIQPWMAKLKELKERHSSHLRAASRMQVEVDSRVKELAMRRLQVDEEATAATLLGTKLSYAADANSYQKIRQTDLQDKARLLHNKVAHLLRHYNHAMEFVKIQEERLRTVRKHLKKIDRLFNQICAGEQEYSDLFTLVLEKTNNSEELVALLSEYQPKLLERSSDAFKSKKGSQSTTMSRRSSLKTDIETKRRHRKSTMRSLKKSLSRRSQRRSLFEEALLHEERSLSHKQSGTGSSRTGFHEEGSLSQSNTLAFLDPFHSLREKRKHNEKMDFTLPEIPEELKPEEIKKEDWQTLLSLRQDKLNCTLEGNLVRQELRAAKTRCEALRDRIAALQAELAESQELLNVISKEIADDGKHKQTILVRVPQSSCEVPPSSKIEDTNSIMLARADDILKLNKQILQAAKRWVSELERVCDEGSALDRLKWIAKGKELRKRDLEFRCAELQLMRVTKQLHASLREGGYETRRQKQQKTLSRQLSFIKRETKKDAETATANILVLSKDIALLENKAKRLDAKLGISRRVHSV
ncbi:MAG: hypothetical protein MHM6MM_002883 [Cercozoa sp. M6MM]